MLYTYKKMADLLKMHLFDVEYSAPFPNKISPTMTEEFLNIAQEKIVGMVNSQYFPELTVISAEQTLVTDGYVDLYGLATVPIFRGHEGIIGVEQTAVVATTCARTTLAEYLELVKRQKKTVASAANKPLYYIVGSYLYVWPNSGISTKIKIYYIREPKKLKKVEDRNAVALTQTWDGSAAMTLNGTLVSGGVAYMPFPKGITFYTSADQTAITADVTGTLRDGTEVTEQLAGALAGETVTSVNQFKTITSITSAERTGSWEVGTAGDCELTSGIQDIILEYAAYIGFDYGHAYDRAQVCLDNVINAVTLLNRKYEPEWAYVPSAMREINIEDNVRTKRDGE